VNTYLGEFEQLLLLAMLQLEEAATAASIRALVEDASDRKVWIGAVHTTLDRLEAKGLVRSSVSERPEGRRKVFVPSAAGARAISRAHHTWTRLSQGLASKLR
jgi:DNA-binding PadR family transcriptional regulator